MTFKIFPFLITYLVSINAEQKIESKSIETNRNARVPILWTADWSPDDNKIAIGGDDGVLRIYETATLKLLKTYEFLSAIQCVDWNQDGKILAIALDDKPAHLLNVETGLFLQLQETTGSRALSWNPNGDLLAIGDYEGSLQIWSKEGKLIKFIKKDNNKTYLGVDWHPKKNIILTGGDKIRLFDTSGNLLQSIKHRKEETIILTVKWHPSGSFFATGDYGDNNEDIESLLQFWSEDGTMIKSLGGSNAEYRNIRWNKDGSFLATASDGLRVWSKNGQIIYTGKTEDLLWGIDWDSQSKNIITSGSEGSTYLWTDKAKLLKTFH